VSSQADISGGFAVVGAGAWLFGPAQPAASRGAFTRRRLKGFVCPDRGTLTRGELAESVSHAKSAKKIAHAESAEFAEKKPHAESAEFAEKKPHAESAEFAEPMRSSDLVSPLRGLEPSGAAVSKITGAGETSRTLREEEHLGARAWCSSSARPFLTRIDCGVPVSAVSDKVLVAPVEARSGARLVKVVPLSIARSLRVTEFSSEWVVVATRSRTTRIALAEGESLGVRPESAVAWTGERPTGFCPRLRLLDVLLPRGPRELLLHFHGPAIVWIEGSEPRPLRKAAPRKAVF